MTICILGAGMAGLTAATQLAARGLRPVVLEAHQQALGGRLRDEPAHTLTQQGQDWSFPAEHGVHGLWSPYVNLNALLEQHGIAPEQQPSREEMWVYVHGQRVRMAAIGSAMHRSPIPAPFHYLSLFLRPRFLAMLNPHDLLALFLVQGRLTSALAIDPLAEGKALDGMSLADFMSGWSPALRSLFAGLARNALAAHPEDAPAAGFIAFLRFYTLMRRDAWKFNYLSGTAGKLICEPLAARAQTLGSDIRLGCRATRLEAMGDQWRVAYNDAQQQEQSMLAERLVLALDAPGAQQLLCDSPELATHAAKLRFPKGVATAIIRVWFSTTPAIKAESGICTGDVLVDNFFWLHELQPAYREWHQATGGSAAELHIYDPPPASTDETMLLARAVADMTRAFPELRGHVLQTTMQRNPAAHTLFTPGDPAFTLGIQTPWLGILACGDWIAHPNPSLYLERAVTTGMLAANLLLEERGLQPWPLRTHPAPERLAGALARRLQGFRQAQVVKRRMGEGA